MRIYKVPRPTSVCHNPIYRCYFTWKQRTDTGITVHEEYRNQADALNSKNLKFFICMAASEVKSLKMAGQKQYMKAGIPFLKRQKQLPAVELSSVSGLISGALSLALATTPSPNARVAFLATH